MRDLRPLRDTTRFEPGIQRIEIGEARHGLPQPSARILHVLLDLALLLAGSRIAELRIEQVMAGHGCEPGIDLTYLAVNQRAILTP